METRNKVRFVVALITIVLINGICFGFDDGDFQYWSSADASFDIDKDWKITFGEEFRLGNHGGNLYYHHSDVGFVYKSFADWIDLGVNYRQAFVKDSEDVWRELSGPHFNITLKGQLFGCDVSNRGRIQYYNTENKRDFWLYRNKVTVKLPFEFTKFKIQPYLADEVFIFDKQGYDRNRLYSGASFKLSKNAKCSIFYLWQSSESGGSWKDTHVLGTSLTFRF